jgi:hypothetical protein
LNQSRPVAPILGLLLCLGIISGLVWGTYQFSKKKVMGEGFLIQWLGIRALVIEGESPYSQAVTEQIRQVIDRENSFIKGYSPRYTSPLYSGIIVLPFALIKDMELAHALWLSFQLLAIFAILLLSLKLTEWRPSRLVFLFFSLVSMFSYHIFLPWLDGGLSIWAAFFLVVALLSLRNNWNEIGGIFLAMAAIQPQMTLLVIIFLLIWAASCHKRILIIWFLVTVVLLSILGLFLVPDWIMQYLRLIFNFSENFPPGSLGAYFMEMWPGLGKQLGWLVSIILGVTVIFEGWIALRKDFRHMLWAACLMVVASEWIGIPTVPGHLIGLILPIILVSAALSERWSSGGQWVTMAVTLIVFLWEWVIFYNNIHGDTPGMQLNLLIPLPLMLLLGLYWVRWWAIRQKRLLIEELRFGESF